MKAYTSFRTTGNPNQKEVLVAKHHSGVVVEVNSGEEEEEVEQE